MRIIRYALVALCGMPLLSSLSAADDSAGAALGWMYWTHREEGVYRAARDGSEVKLLVAMKNADGLAVDPEGGKLYFTVSNVPDQLDTLHSADLDGGNVKQLAGELNWTGDLALDPEAGKLYITSLGDDKIIEISVDGSQRRDLLTGIESPDELAIDAKHGKIYWGSSGGDGIRRANLDGSNPEPVLPQVVAFGLAIDLEREQLFWVDLGTGSIHRVGLDGKNDTQVLAGLQGADGLALDTDNRKLYWTETGKISQGNLDGTGVEVLVTGKTAQYASLVVFPPQE
jgi:sugar lactone lactonase YvrE